MPILHTPEQKLLAVAVASFSAVFVAPLIVRSLIKIHSFARKGREPKIKVGKATITDQARLRHTHIVGATGTGKTVLIENLLFQDLDRGGGALIIDPKGERDFYDKVKAHCEAIGRKDDLFFLSATFKDESNTWNPCALGNASELQTKFFNSAVYSEPHYAKACEFGLLKAFNSLRDGLEQFSIADLIQELKTISQDDKIETLKGLFFDLNNLVHGEWASIIGTPGQNSPKAISLLDIVRHNRILFVDLPTEGKKVQSSRLGRLITQEIILLSGMRKRNPALKSDRPFSVYIDEFDAFATESFSTFLNKGRSSEFMIHLAHQTLSDLNIVSPEFTGQILGNCAVRFIFRQDDPDDAERWSRFLGTRSEIAKTYRTKDGQSTGESSNREVRSFNISPDLIKTLRVGRCIYSNKATGEIKSINVPYPKRKSLNSPLLPAPTRQELDPFPSIAEFPPENLVSKNDWDAIPKPI